ncbi:hypothetical protein J2Y86_000343 [Pseudomonas migulae]|nr:hypothetical protein [Pseudomonas migulae]
MAKGDTYGKGDPCGKGNTYGKGNTCGEGIYPRSTAKQSSSCQAVYLKKWRFRFWGRFAAQRG